MFSSAQNSPSNERVGEENNNNNTYNAPFLKEFTISGNERKLGEVLSRLRFGSKITAGKKANVEKRIVREPGYITTFLRSLDPNENRYKTLEFYKDTAHDTFELLYYYGGKHPNTNNNKFHANITSIIITNLISFRKSLIEMITTYRDDKGFISEIEALVDTLDAKIKAYQPS